jgi:hypothetical protein
MCSDNSRYEAKIAPVAAGEPLSSALWPSKANVGPLLKSEAIATFVTTDIADFLREKRFLR